MLSKYITKSFITWIHIIYYRNIYLYSFIFHSNIINSLYARDVELEVKEHKYLNSTRFQCKQENVKQFERSSCLFVLLFVFPIYNNHALHVRLFTRERNTFLQLQTQIFFFAGA